jgi:hypothetical protein
MFNAPFATVCVFERAESLNFQSAFRSLRAIAQSVRFGHRLKCQAGNC